MMGFLHDLRKCMYCLKLRIRRYLFQKKKKIFCDYAGLAKMLCQNLYLTQYSSQVKKENTDRNNDIIMKLYEILTHTNCNNVAVMFW